MKNTYLIGALAAALPFAAHASPISSVEIISVQQSGGFSGPPGPATVQLQQTDTAAPGDVTVGSPTTFGGNVELEAIQRQDGTSEVTAETLGSGDNTQLNTAIATFTQEEVNSFGMDRDYTLDFTLSGMSAQLNHGADNDFFGPLPGGGTFVNPFGTDFETLIFSNYTAASFQYLIDVNGTNVYSARADALVNDAGGSTENVTEFTTSLTGTPGGFSTWSFSVDDLSGVIDLGTFADGETISVTSTLIAQSYATNVRGEIRNWVGAQSTDPINLSSVGGLASTPSNPMTPVPLPAAGWMLLAGFGGLVAMKRRKTA